MEPKFIELTDELILVGIKIQTTLSEDNTGRLWKSFLERVPEIKSRSNPNYYSVQQYAVGQRMETFTPITTFDKWAAIQVDSTSDIPDGMEVVTIPKGKYVIFKHKGIAADFFRTSQYIFGTWFPNSEYELDDRPHFEIMNSEYLGPEDPNSEEDVYIPVK